MSFMNYPKPCLLNPRQGGLNEMLESQKHTL